MAGRSTAGVRNMAQTKRSREPLSEAGNQSLQSNEEGIFHHNIVKFCQFLNHTCLFLYSKFILKCHKLNMEQEYALQVVSIFPGFYYTKSECNYIFKFIFKFYLIPNYIFEELYESDHLYVQ